MRCFVYVLGSNGRGGFKTYVGWTTDLDRRLANHNNGKGARSTRGEAMSREWRLKRDRAFRKALRVAD